MVAKYLNLDVLRDLHFMSILCCTDRSAGLYLKLTPERLMHLCAFVTFH